MALWGVGVSLYAQEENESPASPEIRANSLGMGFAKVKENIWFGVCEVRISDFEQFAVARETDDTWRVPGFQQAGDHPVVNVTWEQAVKFCEWLTKKEKEAGVLGEGEFYRLPTDEEWSVAAGLGEEKGATPQERDLGDHESFPWGTQWPPPAGSGNIGGEETQRDVAISGYRDDFEFTAPVGSFLPNKYGIYDLCGNVSEWVENWWNAEKKIRVLRGGSWSDGRVKWGLLSACRNQAKPELRTSNYGFRCVLETSSGGKITQEIREKETLTQKSRE